MDKKQIREAVTLYANDAVTETEAARIAGIPRAEFRHYARTSGVITSSPESADHAKNKNRSQG